MTLTRVSRRYPPAMTMAAPPKNMPTPPLVPPAPFITDTILQSNRGRSFISPEKRRRRGTEQDPRDHTEQDHVERQLPHRIERAEHHVEEEPHRHQPPGQARASRTKTPPAIASSRMATPRTRSNSNGCRRSNSGA